MPIAGRTAITRLARSAVGRGLPAALCLLAAASARAQVRIDIRPGDAAQPPAGLEPPNDRDAESWLKRAREAAEREDWKLAADSLNRLIDEHGDRTVSLDEEHYYSAVLLAQRQIADWPPEGLAAYRVLYDPEAERLLDQAKQTFDFNALREIARKFPLTSPGPEAIDLLATWLLDRRQPSEAIELLARLEALPHNPVPRWQTIEKRAVACTLSHQRTAAAEALERLRALGHDPHPALPGDWEARVEAIQRFFEDAKFGSQDPAGRLAAPLWPHRLGIAAGGGRMPPIDPVITREYDLTASLPGADRLNRRLVTKISRRKARPPVWQAVSDGRRLFITCPAGLVARDLATFDFLWQAVPKYRPRNAEITQFRQAAGIAPWAPYYEDPNAPPRLDRLSTATLFHEYRGDVSTAAGLVFVIEQDGTPGEQLPTLQGLAPDNRIVPDGSLVEPNTLRAYEAETGRAVWTKGRGGPPDDPLRQAHFKATPILVGSYLVAPYVQGGDYALAVLNRDGTVARRVLIGTGRAGLFPMNGVLQPALHDGTLYVQTGAGQLSALSAYDFSLRWLTRYERARHLEPKTVVGRGVWGGTPRGYAQPDEWLTSPPVVAGSLVLLAPHDSDRLFAFDRTDGKERWSIPRAAYRYLVGADRVRVVIAGEKLAAIDLETGRPRWVSDGLQPTGRAAICGDHVLVPTSEGLLRLDLETGRPAGKALETDAPLGNLLAIDGALYSVGADRVSKFPDPVQSRALACARLDQNPKDVQAMIRLAWLATLTGEWQTALDLLDQANAEVGDPPPLALGPIDFPAMHAADESRARIAHLRVRALLRLAADAAEEEMLPLLERAAAAAHSPGDRVKTGLALCEYLADRGRWHESFTRGVALLTEVGDQPVRLDPDLKSRTDIVIGERLGRFWRSMTDSDRAAAAEFLEDFVGRMDPNTPQDVLVLLADGLGFLELGPRLDLHLGRQALAEGRHETGIFFLERAARRAPGTPLELEALLRLAMAYRFPAGRAGRSLDAPAAPARAAALLQRLATAHAEAELPPDLTTLGGPVPLASVRDFVERIRATLPAELFAGTPPVPRILTRAGALALLSEDYVPGGMPPDAASFWDRADGHDVFAEIMPLVVSRQVRGLRTRAADGHRYYWASDLEDHGAPASRSTTGFALDARAAALAGRVVALSQPAQVCCIGLTTGRAMWAPVEVSGAIEDLPDPPVLDVDGLILAAEDAGTLVAIPARDNARRLWRRHWPSRRLRMLRAVDGMLAVVDQNATKVFIVDPRSGRMRSVHSLLVGRPVADAGEEDIESRDPDAHVALVGRVICRSGHKTVVGRDVLTGRTMWTVELAGRVRALLELGPRHLGIVRGTNGFSVVQADSGRVVRELTADGLVMPPRDAVVDATAGGDERLLLFTRTDDSPSEAEYVLASFPLAGGGRPWRKELGRFATLSRQMMRASPRFVAAVSNEVAATDARLVLGRTVPGLDTQLAPRLVVVDKRTGLRMREGRLQPYEFDEGRLGEGRHASRLIRDVIILNDRIIAVAPEGYYVLADRNEVLAGRNEVGRSD